MLIIWCCAVLAAVIGQEVWEQCPPVVLTLHFVPSQLMLPAGQRVEYKYVILEEQVRSGPGSSGSQHRGVTCAADRGRPLTVRCCRCS
jgi:hypothetical protein